MTSRSIATSPADRRQHYRHDGHLDAGTGGPRRRIARPARNGERTVATDTHVDQRTGTAVTTTTTERPVGTTTTADRRDARDAYRGYPDHAVVNMTKDQLKALPEVRYAR